MCTPHPRHPTPAGARAGRAARRVALGALALVVEPIARLQPCPACGVRPADGRGSCAPCRLAWRRPGVVAHTVWLGPYDGPLGACVRALKYGGAVRLARPLGSELGREVLRLPWHPDRVVPVPPHRRDATSRDHAGLLAHHVALALEIPLHHGLERTRPSARQAALGAAARRANVAGVFRAGSLRGARVLLVDDVFTTGATAEACAAALRGAGAAHVRVAVVARAARPPAGVSAP